MHQDQKLKVQCCEKQNDLSTYFMQYLRLIPYILIFQPLFTMFLSSLRGCEPGNYLLEGTYLLEVDFTTYNRCKRLTYTHLTFIFPSLLEKHVDIYSKYFIWHVLGANSSPTPMSLFRFSLIQGNHLYYRNTSIYLMRRKGNLFICSCAPIFHSKTWPGLLWNQGSGDGENL